MTPVAICFSGRRHEFQEKLSNHNVCTCRSARFFFYVFVKHLGCKAALEPLDMSTKTDGPEQLQMHLPATSHQPVHGCRPQLPGFLHLLNSVCTHLLQTAGSQHVLPQKHFRSGSGTHSCPRLDMKGKQSQAAGKRGKRQDLSVLPKSKYGGEDSQDKMLHGVI